MFTRLDAERNAKNLKRAVNNNKLTEEQYNEAVDKMDEYVSLPARRLSELVRKFVHHKNMMRIEGGLKSCCQLMLFVSINTHFSKNSKVNGIS